MSWDWEKLKQQQRPAKKNTEFRSSGDNGGGQKNKGEDIFTELRKILPDGRILKIAIIVILVLWIGSGIFSVDSGQVGVIQRFGSYVRTVGAGMHYHLPWPIEQNTVVAIEQTRVAQIGSNQQDDGKMLTGDENLIDLQFVVQYKIKDAESYLFNIVDGDKTVRDAAQAAMRDVIGSTSLDAALTDGKPEVQINTQKFLQELLDSYESGIEVLSVQLQDVHPPALVIDAFRDVASAREDKSKLINEAEAYSNDLLPRARGNAAALLNQAEGYKSQVINAALGESEKFNEIYAQYKESKNITRSRMYLETMEFILQSASVEKIILPAGNSSQVIPYLPLGQLNSK